MVTRDYKRQSTATQAVNFFEEMFPSLTEGQLQAYPPMMPDPNLRGFQAVFPLKNR